MPRPTGGRRRPWPGGQVARAGQPTPMQRARIATFAVGAVLFAAALALHPILLDPAGEAAAYPVIGADRLWPAVHWVALAGITLWTLPLASAPDSAPAARQALAVGLALWIAVLTFEATALPQLAAARVPGFWAWTLALGYLGAVLDGLGIALLGWSPGTGSGRRLRASGAVIAGASVLAYAAPGAAVPLLACAGAAALHATGTALRRWSTQAEAAAVR